MAICAQRIDLPAERAVAGKRAGRVSRAVRQADCALIQRNVGSDGGAKVDPLPDRGSRSG